MVPEPHLGMWQKPLATARLRQQSEETHQVELESGGMRGIVGRVRTIPWSWDASFWAGEQQSGEGAG